MPLPADHLKKEGIRPLDGWRESRGWVVTAPPVIPAAAGGDHYREMAGKLRDLARATRSPGIRRELVDFARRYDRRGEHFDRRAR